jgi:ubiquinol-cytochrome c reductase cytochrome c1 subunit
MSATHKNHNGLLSLIGFGALAVIGGSLGYLYFGHEAHHGAAAKLENKSMEWAFDGITGSFDRQSAQRGFQVYKEVCAACHGVERLAFRNLSLIGFSEGEIKEIAKGYTFSTLNDSGEAVDRPGLPSDTLPPPYPNELAARAANNGAYPPDLSLMIKARPDGADYMYSLLTGYSEPPADFPLGEGMHYNAYFEGRQIAMPAPLADGQVTYMDGTAATVDQMAKDVTNFLQFVAEPEMEHRKQMGLKVMIFLAVFTGLFVVAKRRVWSKVKN